jgi:hypothetical protein
VKLKAWYLVLLAVVLVLGFLTGSIAGFVVTLVLCLASLFCNITEMPDAAAISVIAVFLDGVVNVVWIAVRHLH